MLCIIVDLYAKWATVLDGKLIGTSKHKDYSIFHWKAHDVKALKVPITKFVLVDARGEVDEVILAEALKERGQNYKTAKRDDAELTDVELAEVNAAFVLARAHLKANPLPTVNEPPIELPAAEKPKIFLTPEAVALGLTAVDQVRRDELARRDKRLESLDREVEAAGAEIEVATTADELIAAVDKMHAAGLAIEVLENEAVGASLNQAAELQPSVLGSEDTEADLEGEHEPEVDAGTKPEDPLATLKPSRKKKRR